jgi:hypothetical protein
VLGRRLLTGRAAGEGVEPKCDRRCADEAETPSASLMPHSQTILRAISVACSMSFCAPVVICAKVDSSAMRPPMQTAMRASSWSFDQLWRSSLGSC